MGIQDVLVADGRIAAMRPAFVALGHSSRGGRLYGPSAHSGSD